MRVGPLVEANGAGRVVLATLLPLIGCVTTSAGGDGAAFRSAEAVARSAGPREAQGSVRDPGMIEIAPGASIQAAVRANPPATTFLLRAGVFREQRITPKPGNSFIGEPGAVLNGSRLLTVFLPREGVWIAGVDIAEEEWSGTCLPAYPRCRSPHQVFVDDQPLRHARDIASVGAGSYYVDYATRQVYLGANPAGRTVEIAVTPWAFGGEVSWVTIRGVTVEKYANPPQVGAIRGSEGSNWLVEDNTVRKNHGVGITIGPGGHIRRNAVTYNGQLGVSADGAFAVVEDNEIAFNNTAGFLPEWEGGGSKFAETQDLAVRNNYVHHNNGYGLWTDIDNIRTVYEGNLVTDNTHAGIFHEISYAALIRNNHCYRNGSGEAGWIWGGQIQVATSRDVVVTGNVVVVDGRGGNGIVVLQQDRGSGALGLRQTRNVSVKDNEVVYLGRAGLSGGAADHDEPGMLAGNVVFDSNLYRFSSEPTRWRWHGRDVDLLEFRAAGQEANGSVDNRVVLPSR
ncbi:MAG: right-handed parallel beta-helix repeat-containing protein [Bryobacteraceae bacterium]